MALELVTGYRGAIHVTAAQDADFQRGIFMTNGRLEVGGQMNITIAAADEIMIADGVCMIDGRECYIGYGESEMVVVPSGSVGYKRNDIIVIRYERDETTGVETCSFEVISGQQVAEGEPVDPTYTDMDIRTGASVSQKAFCRVHITDAAISSVDMLMDFAQMQAYPVGAVYSSTLDETPAFYGEWEKLDESNGVYRWARIS